MMDTSKIIRLDHRHPDGSKHVLIEWSLGNKCNYACSYCPKHLHDGSIGWHPYETLISFLDSAHEHYHDKLGKGLMVQYTGGEPTVYPRFRDMVKHAHERGYLQGMISNGSRTIRFWESVREFFTKISLTFHREFADPDHYINVVRCVSETTPVHCNITMIPEEFDNNLRMAERLWELDNVSVLLKPLREEFKGELYPYTQEQLQIMAQARGKPPVHVNWPRFGMKVVYEDGTEEQCRVNEMVINKQNRWKGWECSAGVEQVVVTIEGDVFIGRCRVGGAIGNLNTGVNFPDKNVICTKEECWCLTDMLTTKVKR